MTTATEEVIRMKWDAAEPIENDTEQVSATDCENRKRHAQEWINGDNVKRAKCTSEDIQFLQSLVDDTKCTDDKSKTEPTGSRAVRNLHRAIEESRIPEVHSEFWKRNQPFTATVTCPQPEAPTTNATSDCTVRRLLWPINGREYTIFELCLLLGPTGAIEFCQLPPPTVLQEMKYKWTNYVQALNTFLVRTRLGSVQHDHHRQKTFLTVHFPVNEKRIVEVAFPHKKSGLSNSGVGKYSSNLEQLEEVAQALCGPYSVQTYREWRFQREGTLEDMHERTENGHAALDAMAVMRDSFLGCYRDLYGPCGLY
jgi:hypothetical protein